MGNLSTFVGIAVVKKVNDGGVTPLHMAAAMGNTATMEMLEKYEGE